MVGVPFRKSRQSFVVMVDTGMSNGGNPPRLSTMSMGSWLVRHPGIATRLVVENEVLLVTVDRSRMAEFTLLDCQGAWAISCMLSLSVIIESVSSELVEATSMYLPVVPSSVKAPPVASGVQELDSAMLKLVMLGAAESMGNP